ncbi:regulatory protein, luxR family [Pricia antarctica]|uniref:Regulatory protein, luxR family n=1 Tax=Pricia antarctica TaxID=641691 RepID=A0A1G6W2R9_9FLAO|nr:LuxR C-terminal-related transcriptional regulator [Pricia antarctica]SDD60094.1 regulatory protein, luxR family [Pricia antarctica]
MLSLTFIVVFVLCFAIAIICILIGHELVNTYKSAFCRSYFYYLIAFFVFSLYAVWGQIGMQALLVAIHTTNDVEILVTHFIPVLGMPFFGIAMIMFLKMVFDLVEAPLKSSALSFHLIIFLIIATVLGGLYLGNKETLLLGKTISFYFILLIWGIEFLYLLFFTGIIVRHQNKVPPEKRKKVLQFTLLLVTGLLLRGVSLAFYEAVSWMLAPLILLYFISHLMALWYIRQQSDRLFAPIGAEQPNTDKKEHLYQKYRITPREQEVIEQLCLGKTNQQIADTLFISLQTVKDHTHRIYNKVGINSRMKLLQMVND